ncbi:hypothetical protein SFC08_14705 [Lysinibacillus halotolerans]
MVSGFQYGGIWSNNMGLTIDAKTSQASPTYDVEFVEVPGLDGDLAIDNKRLMPFTYPIHVFLKDDVDVHAAATRISQWLKSDVRYKDLLLSWDSNYIYKAIFYEQFDIQDILPKFGKISLNFKCHPVKYLAEGMTPQNINNGSSLINPELRSAKPLIKIVGSGDITLKNNGVDWLILRAVDGYISVDSNAQLVYKDSYNQFDKMMATLSPLFPQLKPGENLITFTGNVTSVEITPRWEATI